MMLSDLIHIAQKKHLSTARRLALLYFAVKVRTVRLFANRLFKESSIKEISGLGFTISINTFSEFYWTFREIFIEEEYYFTTDSAEPNVIDCGGHIGLATLYFTWLHPEANIVVFEPLPENFRILQKNIDQNKLTNVKALQAAVSDSEGELSFAGDGRAGHLVKSDGEEAITVKTMVLSKFVSEEVDLCKIDIEGAESSVVAELASSKKLSKIKKLVMEYHLLPNNSLGSIISNFEDNNMKVSFNSTLDPLKPSPRDFTHIMLVASEI